MYARTNRVMEKIGRGEMVTGMEVWLRDPRMVELLGQAGFDFVHIENEHVAHDWESLENLIRTAESVGLTPLFRCEQCVDGNPPVNQIIKALKCGAQIIMVPQVSTPEAARRVVDAAKYPPIGRRGIATCDRSAREIIPREIAPLDMPRFVREANEQIMLWAIIETPEAVRNIDAILDVDGIDAVGFGHQDYAIAAGLSSDAGPEVDEAREKVRAATRRKGKLMWWTTHKPELVEEQTKKGIQIILMGVDIIHINSYLRNIIREIKK